MSHVSVESGTYCYGANEVISQITTNGRKVNKDFA